MPILESGTAEVIFHRTYEYIQPVLNAILAAVMALLHGAYRNVGVRRCLLNAAICALLAWTVRDVLKLLGWELAWANIASVLIGFLGTDYLAILIRKFIVRKTGFKNMK